MGLDEDAVHLLEIDGADLIADGFDEGGQAEVAGAAQEPFAGAHEQCQGFGGEDVVAEACVIELTEDKALGRFWTQARQDDGVSNAGADFLVNGKGEGLEEGRLTDENEVVRRRKVFAQQAQFAQAIARHEMGVIDDRDEHFAGAMDFEGFLDQEAFAAMVAPFELDLKGFAEDA